MTGNQKTEIQAFTFPITNQSVRTVTIDGEPHWVAKDVCDVLGIDTSNLSKTLDSEDYTTCPVQCTDQVRTMAVINESGLYSLILTSRKPEAKSFKKWVTSEVLPSIRKTGGYGINRVADILDDPAQANNLMLELMVRREKDQAEIRALTAEVSAMTPKVEAFKRIEGAEGSMCVTDAAKTLSIQPKRLFDYLSIKKWAYKRPGNVSWLGYQDKIQAGYVEHSMSEVPKPDGSIKVRTQMKLTAKGIAKLGEELNGTLFN